MIDTVQNKERSNISPSHKDIDNKRKNVLVSQKIVKGIPRIEVHVLSINEYVSPPFKIKHVKVWDVLITVFK
jgi:hypothetical protein